MDAPEPHANPTRVGRFAVLRRLGSGGMGVVYVAYDDVLDRKVAVKVLGTALSGTRRAHVRFVQREAQAMARLSHPNVVQVYEVGEHDAGGLYVAMELVAGNDLATWLREGPQRGWRERLEALIGAGRGLAAAHAAGVVHRDFKPHNVIVGDDGRARVVDFGLAGPASLDEAAVSASERPLAAGSDADLTPTSDRPRELVSPLTPGGTVLGTPGYMPPEQFLGQVVDARSDQFAFCVTAWEVMFGSRPFVGPTRAAILNAILQGEITTPTQTLAMPSATRTMLRETLLRGLAVDPAARFETMDALLGVLARDVTAIRRRRVVAVVATTTVAGAAWLGYALGQPMEAPCTGFGDAIAQRWNDDTRQEIKRAFTATGSPLGAASAAAATRAIDAQAAAILATREASCLATHVRHEVSTDALAHVYACLDDDQRSLFAMVDVLGTADASIVAHTTDAIASFADPARCTSATDAEPTPDAAHAGLREAIAAAGALHLAGALQRGRAAIDAAVTSANTLADARSLADALVLRGRIERDLGLLAPAQRTLEEAIDVADAARNDRARLDALLAIADVFGDGTRSLDAEARAIAQSRAVADRIGATSRDRASIASAAVDHALRSGRLDEARVAIAALVEHSDPDDADRVEREAFLARSEGDPDRALALYDAARTRAVAEHGALHPRTAAATYNAGVARVAVGDFTGAIALVEAALASWQAIYGETPSEDLGRAHVALLGCKLGLGDLAAAREHATAAMSAYSAAVGRDHPGRSEALLGLAVVEFTEGRFDDAVAHNHEAVEILANAWGERHPQTGIARSNLGESLFAQGRFDDAHRELGTAVEVLSAALGADASDLAFPLKGLGLVVLARGDAVEATRLLERALALNGAADPLERLDISAALAIAAAATGDSARAHTLASDAKVDPTNAAAVERRRSLVAWLPTHHSTFALLGLLPAADAR